MAVAKKKITVRPRKSVHWEAVLEAVVNGKLPANIYLPDEEIYISCGDDAYTSIVIKRDGTWDRQ